MGVVMKTNRIHLSMIVLITFMAVLCWSPGLRAQTQEEPACADVISAGYDHSLALKNGTVYAWGKNDYGQLGDGGRSSSRVPVQVANLHNVIAISAGSGHSLALTEGGIVYAWGRNDHGQLGNGGRVNSRVPFQVADLNNVIAISAGGYDSLALTEDGTVYVWGNNVPRGQVGGSSNVPVQVQGLSNITAISTGGNHSLVLTEGGLVYAWGFNEYGQLGNGLSSTSHVPVQVQGSDGDGALSGIVAISVGRQHSLALAENGDVYAWGYNEYGQLGNNSITDSYLPVRVPGLTGIKVISTKKHHSLAMSNDGSVYAWGDNEYGQLGVGGSSNGLVPIQVVDLDSIRALSAGGGHGLALKHDGSVYAWGFNYFGQLGDGTNYNRMTPVQVDGLAEVACAQEECVSSEEICDEIDNDCDGSIDEDGVCDVVEESDCEGVVSAGDNHSLVLKESSVYAWGKNEFGQLGINSTSDSYIPVSVIGLNGAGSLTNMSAVSAGYEHSLALGRDEKVYAWGRNDSGQLGINSGSDSHIPVQVQGLNNIMSISAGGSHSLALTKDGKVYAWGSNGNGQLGRNTENDGNVPVQVESLPRIKAISAGYRYSLALADTGEIYAWGMNRSGQLGNNSSSDSSEPVRVQGLSNIKAISTASHHSLALTDTGEVYAWGENENGQIGDGTTSDRHVPVQVQGLRNIKAVSAGSVYSLALTGDGDLYAWGDNQAGQFGNGSYTSSTVPIRSQDVDDIKAVFAGNLYVLALTDNGRIDAWGNNDSGELGNDSTSDSNRPVPVHDLDGITCEEEECISSEETCDGIDNDCDGEVDEDFSVGESCTVGEDVCAVTGRYVCNTEGNGVICDAQALELLVDDMSCGSGPCVGQKRRQRCGSAGTWSEWSSCNSEGRPAGDCSAGEGACQVAGKRICSAAGTPICNAQPADGTAETCDGVDNDCDGTVDLDAEGNPLQQACSKACGDASRGGTRYCSNGTYGECLVYSSAEVCNGLDDDCDGVIDNDVTDPEAGKTCGNLAARTVYQCVDGELVCGTGKPDVDECTPTGPEICDGIDNDCMGGIDDGWPRSYRNQCKIDGEVRCVDGREVHILDYDCPYFTRPQCQPRSYWTGGTMSCIACNEAQAESDPACRGGSAEFVRCAQQKALLSINNYQSATTVSLIDERYRIRLLKYAEGARGSSSARVEVRALEGGDRAVIVLQKGQTTTAIARHKLCVTFEGVRNGMAAFNVKRGYCCGSQGAVKPGIVDRVYKRMRGLFR